MSLMLHEMLLNGEGSTVSVSIVSTISANATTCALPTGTAAGDLVIFFDSPGSSAAGAVATKVLPPGFTEIIDNFQASSGAQGAVRQTISYKVMNAADIAAGSVTGATGSSSSRKYMMTIRPLSPFASVSVDNLQGYSAATTLPIAPITNTYSKTKVFLAFLTARVAGTRLESPSSTGTLATTSAPNHIIRYFTNITNVNDTLTVTTAPGQAVMQGFVLWLNA